MKITIVGIALGVIGYLWFAHETSLQATLALVVAMWGNNILMTMDKP